MRLIKFAKNWIMLEPFFTISKIHREAINSAQKDLRGNPLKGAAQTLLFFLLFIAPALISILGILSHNPLLRTIETSINRLNDFVGVSMPLFVGVFFSLLLTIPSNIRRSRSSEMDSESKQKLIKGYKQISTIILHLILVCVYIVICFLFSCVFVPHNIYTQLTYYLFVISLSSHFIMVIVYLVVRYYYLYKNEM